MPSGERIPGLEAAPTQLGKWGASNETAGARVITTGPPRPDQEDAATEDLGRISLSHDAVKRGYRPAWEWE